MVRQEPARPPQWERVPIPGQASVLVLVLLPGQAAQGVEARAVVAPGSELVQPLGLEWGRE